MPAEVEHSQCGSNSYDGRGSMEYPENATVGDKVDWLRIALSPASPLRMQANALRGLSQELHKRDTLSCIMEKYGRESYDKDVYACTERLSYSENFVTLSLYRATLLQPEDFDAISISARCKKNSRRDANRLISVRTASEIEEIKERYHAIFGVRLEVDLRNFTDGDHKELLQESTKIPPAWHGDDDVVMVDREHIETAVGSLYEGISKLVNSARRVFIENEVGKSKEYIDAVLDAYAANYSRSLETDLASALDACLIVDGLLTKRKCSVNRPTYFADMLHTAKNLNDGETIVWAITTMAKRPDMKRIKEEYLKAYERTLEDDVSDEFSGHQDTLELIRSLLNYNVPN